MNFPALGSAVWKYAITNKLADDSEVTQEGEAVEKDCRVLLWDKNRSMIVTIDNRELRWHLDSKDAALSTDTLASDITRRPSVPLSQRGSWVSGCESVWMSIDGHTFFVGYPTLSMFCEWNSESLDDVFARYHVIDTQVQLHLPLLKLQVILSSSFAMAVPNVDGSIDRIPYHITSQTHDVAPPLPPPNQLPRKHIQVPSTSPSPSSRSPSAENNTSDRFHSSTEACDDTHPTPTPVPSHLPIFRGSWHRQPWRKWIGNSGGSGTLDLPVCLTVACVSAGAGRWGEQAPLFSVSAPIQDICSRHGSSETSLGELGRGCRCLSCTFHDRIWCGSPRRSKDCVNSDTHCNKIIKQPLTTCFCRMGDGIKGVKLQCAVCDLWYHERCIKELRAYRVNFTPSSLQPKIKKQTVKPAVLGSVASAFICPACATVHDGLKQLRLAHARGLFSRKGISEASTSDSKVRALALRSPRNVKIRGNTVIRIQNDTQGSKESKVNKHRDNHDKREPPSASKRQRECASAAPDTPSKAVAAAHKTKQRTPSEKQAMQRQEMAVIMGRITKDGFELKHVDPDGSCLFRAMSLQLVARDSSWTARRLRQLAAEHLESHEEEYSHFVDDSLGSFKEYCRRIRGTHWGSDIEIQALCKVTGYSVQVYSAERIIWFHPDIDAEAQFEIEHAHVGLVSADVASAQESSSCEEQDEKDDKKNASDNCSRHVPDNCSRHVPERPASKTAPPKPPSSHISNKPSSSHISKCPKGFVPMLSSDYMSASARAGCLEDSSNVVRGEPFTTLERDAQLSFALDHSGMAFGSRKTWGIFAEQTGSKRNLDSLRSFVNATEVQKNLHELSGNAKFSSGAVAVTRPSVEDDDVEPEDHSSAPPHTESETTMSLAQYLSQHHGDDVPGPSNLKCDVLAAFETEAGNGIEPICQQTHPLHESCEVISKDTEMIEPDTEMIEPDTEMIKPDTQMIKPDTEMIEPDTEMIEPDTEMMQQDSETITEDSAARQHVAQITKSHNNTSAEHQSTASACVKSECDELSHREDEPAGDDQDDHAAPASSQHQRRNIKLAVPSSQPAHISSEAFSPVDYLAAFNILRLSFHKHELCGGEHYNAVVSRRRVGQEWKASAFVDPPNGRRRKMGAGAKRSKKSSSDVANDESGVDVDGGDLAEAEAMEVSKAALNGDKEVVVAEDDAAAVGDMEGVMEEDDAAAVRDMEGVMEEDDAAAVCSTGGVMEEDDAAAVRGEDSDSMTSAFAATGSVLPDLSIITDTAFLTSTTLPACSGDGSPTVAAGALSPIDGVPSYDDAGGAFPSLDESSRSHVMHNAEERDVQSLMCDEHE